MREFAYQRATQVREALVAGNGGGRYLGGGTNLVDLMKNGVEAPARLVDVRFLPLDGVRENPDGGLVIGATTTNSDAAAHPEVRRRFPALSQAVLAGASGQSRNMATVGGNLLQRTRCAYFTDPSQRCNKRVPGSGCAAITGEHHNHAILGWSDHCVATRPEPGAGRPTEAGSPADPRRRGGLKYAKRLDDATFWVMLTDITENVGNKGSHR